MIRISLGKEKITESDNTGKKKMKERERETERESTVVRSVW